MTRLARKNARGEWEHLGQDGWFVVDHPAKPSGSVVSFGGPGTAVEKPLELPADVSADLTARDTLAPIISTALTLIPIAPAHDAPPSEPETVTLRGPKVANVV